MKTFPIVLTLSLAAAALPCAAGSFVNHCEAVAAVYPAKSPGAYQNIGGIALGNAYPQESVRWLPSRMPYIKSLALFAGKMVCVSGYYSMVRAEPTQKYPDVRSLSGSSGKACILGSTGPLACPAPNGWHPTIRD